MTTLELIHQKEEQALNHMGKCVKLRGGLYLMAIWLDGKRQIFSIENQYDGFWFYGIWGKAPDDIVCTKRDAVVGILAMQD